MVESGKGGDFRELRNRSQSGQEESYWRAKCGLQGGASSQPGMAGGNASRWDSEHRLMHLPALDPEANSRCLTAV